VLGDKVVPDGDRIERVGGEDIERGHQWECQTALATAKKTGVTEACFCIATEGQRL